MKISRALVLSCFALTSTAAFAQTLPPPAYAGQSYWFGPGPQGASTGSFTQTDGGYGEMYDAGSGFVTGVFGGPAFLSDQSFGSIRRHGYSVNTSVTVQPYIYVDGYFGLTSQFSGYLQTGGNTNVGASRFYVVHNCPVNIAHGQFTNLTNGGYTMVLTLDFHLLHYATTSGGINETHSIQAETMDAFNRVVDVSDDGGVLQVDITRRVTTNATTAAGTYSGTGSVLISSI